jgi:hypothetical protein
MSRRSDLNWKPSGAGPVKSTQRVTERMDYDAGTGDVCLDLSAKAIDIDYSLPVYEMGEMTDEMD